MKTGRRWLFLLILLLLLIQAGYFISYYTTNTYSYFTGYILSYTECEKGVIITIDSDNSVEPGYKHCLVTNEDLSENTYGKAVFENRLIGVYVVIFTEPYMRLDEIINVDYVYRLRDMVVWTVEWERIIDEGIYMPPSNE